VEINWDSGCNKFVERAPVFCTRESCGGRWCGVSRGYQSKANVCGDSAQHAGSNVMLSGCNATVQTKWDRRDLGLTRHSPISPDLKSPNQISERPPRGGLSLLRTRFPECPLLAGHTEVHRTCPQTGIKRTWRFALQISAYYRECTWNERHSSSIHAASRPYAASPSALPALVA
jgi:hypothetical protein